MLHSGTIVTDSYCEIQKTIFEKFMKFAEMSRYPIRNSRTRKLRPLDFTALEILK